MFDVKYKEFRRHLGKAGLSVNEFASLIDVLPNSVSNYAKKETVPISYAALAILLGDAGDNGRDFRALLEKFGVMFKRETQFAASVARLDEYRNKPKKRS